MLGISQISALPVSLQAQEEGGELPADDPEGFFAPSGEEPETEITVEEIPEETSGTEETDLQETAEEPEESPESEPQETSDTELISYSVAEDLQAADLFGEAAMNEDIAFTVLQENLGLDDAEAGELMASLFTLGDSRDVPEYPSRSDDTEINRINVHWITPDTVDNGDESLLYVRPSGDNPFNVRLQIDYALSGEHNYEPGDITITIPASVIHRRSGGFLDRSRRAVEPE